MKFHAILVVRDEGDIIQQCLEHTLTWCDAIYAYDTGSTDDTWEIIQHFAQRDYRVVPFRKEPVIFHDGIRAYIFSKFRDRAEQGDWFLRLDADERYYISPPEFVRTKLQKHETCVYNQTYEFRLTAKEVADWESGCKTLSERQQPIEERRRFFIPLQYSEPRMFQYRRSMEWTPDCAFPYNAGFVARQRIPICHYPHRDPLQLQRRCALRSVMATATTGVGRHWLANEWQKLVVDNNTENLQYWEPSTILPEYNFLNHIVPLPKRILQRFVHASLLPLLDRTRPKFSASYDTEPISAELDKLLKSMSQPHIFKSH